MTNASIVARLATIRQHSAETYVMHELDRLTNDLQAEPDAAATPPAFDLVAEGRPTVLERLSALEGTVAKLRTERQAETKRILAAIAGDAP